MKIVHFCSQHTLGGKKNRQANKRRCKQTQSDAVFRGSTDTTSVQNVTLGGDGCSAMTGNACYSRNSQQHFSFCMLVKQTSLYAASVADT